MLASLLLAAVAATPGGPPPAPAPDAGAEHAARRTLDRLVAVVDKQPLFLSELEFEARVTLVQTAGLAAATAALADEDYASALDWSILQRLVQAEADRLKSFEEIDKDLAKEVKAFEARFPTPAHLSAFLARYDASPEQLVALLRRGLRVNKFLDQKIQLSARVSEDDMRRYWTDHAAELGGQPFERVRDVVKAILTRERTRALTKKQVEELRAKADVRRVATFGEGVREEAP